MCFMKWVVSAKSDELVRIAQLIASELVLYLKAIDILQQHLPLIDLRLR